LIDKIVDGYIDCENFYLFALTKINNEGSDRAIGFGILGKVYISDKFKENTRNNLMLGRSLSRYDCSLLKLLFVD